ncbi:uncharacterized protein LOC129910243 [Episyrphus balteatus]|uniref:uncharacterized protein LOC129910243 n=1 Tax=Episyrphus balteatus TaxID=286459 RepID=UPI0024859C7F|nr:uncharacterized protein LOC129910243 [Episyrphus balteatus]
MTSNNDKVIKFVEIIEQHECLYRNNIPEYTNKTIVQSTWAEISREMEWPVADCLEKWRNIRHAFVRSLKSSHKQKQYYLHNNLLFLLPFIRKSPNCSIDHEHFGANCLSSSRAENETTNSIENLEPPPLPPLPPRPSISWSSFLMGLVPQLEQIPEEETVEARKKIKDFVDQILKK